MVEHMAEDINLWRLRVDIWLLAVCVLIKEEKKKPLGKLKCMCAVLIPQHLAQDWTIEFFYGYDSILIYKEFVFIPVPEPI